MKLGQSLSEEGPLISVAKSFTHFAQGIMKTKECVVSKQTLDIEIFHFTREEFLYLTFIQICI